MPLRNGHAPQLVSLGGPTATLDSYCVFAASAGDMMVELLNGAGKTILEATVTVPSTAGGVTLKSLIEALGPTETAAWALADGAKVQAEVLVNFNTSSVTGAAVGVNVSGSTIGRWLAATPYLIGWVSV